MEYIRRPNVSLWASQEVSTEQSPPVLSTSIALFSLPQAPRLSFTSSHSSSNPQTPEDSHTVSGKNKSIRQHQTRYSERLPVDIPVLKFVQMFLCSISQASNSLKVSSQETLFSIKNHVRRKLPKERKLLPTIASYSKHHRQKGYKLTPLVSGDKSGWKAQGGTAGWEKRTWHSPRHPYRSCPKARK